MSEVITTIAPKGMRCSECLCCAAEIIEEFEGRKRRLCGPCDDGTHPAVSAQKPTQPEPERRIAVQGASKPITLHAPVITVHPPTISKQQMEKLAPLVSAAIRKINAQPPSQQPQPLPHYMGRRKAMTVSGKPFKKVATEEQIEQIRTADPAERAKTLAQRIGVKEHIVYFYRAKFNGGSAKATDAPKASVPAAPAKNAAIQKPPASTAIALRPSAPQIVVDPLTVTLPVGIVDASFATLGPQQKAQIFAAHFDPRLEGSAR